jgi:hypothetical protein
VNPTNKAYYQITNWDYVTIIPFEPILLTASLNITQHHSYAAASLFIINPDCLVTFTPTHMYMLYFLNYLIPLHIDSVLVLLVRCIRKVFRPL